MARKRYQRGRVFLEGKNQDKYNGKFWGVPARTQPDARLTWSGTAPGDAVADDPGPAPTQSAHPAGDGRRVPPALANGGVESRDPALDRE